MNADLNPALVPVMAALLNNGKDAALKCIAETLAGPAEHHRAQADKLEAAVILAQNLVTLMTSGAGGVPSVIQAAQPPSEDKEWRTHVLKAADDIADLFGNEVSVEDVLGELSRAGVALQGKRPGTSVGNILARDARWVRLDSGNYKRQSATEETSAE